MKLQHKTLLVHIKHQIGIVQLNRPRRHNAINGTLIAELTEVMGTLGDDPAVRAVVITGAGDSFCAGADVQWMKRIAGGSAASRADARALTDMMHRIGTLSKPTIARVQGAAFAEGLGLVAACDMAVAAYDAEFCLPEVRFGLTPETTCPYLVRAMGERTALRYALTAERFSAAEAYRIGLLSDLAPLEELDARINDLLGHLLRGAPITQQTTKKQFRMAAAHEPFKGDAPQTADPRTAAESLEGILSLIEKREPAWAGLTHKTAAKTAKPAKARRRKA
ncbi:MAG: enoyl-CoA hydratase-related protein [Thermodesulfobacteriota bacterium]